MDKDTQDIVLPILVGSVAITVFVTVFWWFDRRSKVILQKWADEHGFEITQKKQRYMLFTGPFKFWTNSRNQIIYYFTVRSRDGQEHSGWARCGSYWGGVFFSNQIEVRWDDQEPAA